MALVTSKAKLPAKRLRESVITVPRRELKVLAMGAKLMAKPLVTYEPIYKQVEPHMYGDSPIILNWVDNASKMDAFVDNRVPLETTNNGSDAVSRWMTAEEYLDPDHLFWTGPLALMRKGDIKRSLWDLAKVTLPR